MIFIAITIILINYKWFCMIISITIIVELFAFWFDMAMENGPFTDDWWGWLGRKLPQDRSKEVVPKASKVGYIAYH
jgi:hypothetical protein